MYERGGVYERDGGHVPRGGGGGGGGGREPRALFSRAAMFG